jgi:hypothetical protein
MARFSRCANNLERLSFNRVGNAASPRVCAVAHIIPGWQELAAFLLDGLPWPSLSSWLPAIRRGSPDLGELRSRTSAQHSLLVVLMTNFWLLIRLATRLRGGRKRLSRAPGISSHHAGDMGFFERRIIPRHLCARQTQSAREGQFQIDPTSRGRSLVIVGSRKLEQARSG